ncbi:hypothetical protein CP960_12870 [Malaciobacter halophilus]|uniref:Uroporphyrinogen III synthase HEM4 n=1 Tax=Malaciobacter halophilus TaxID=197482 RepID=A0A2N1IZM6_9BACT|nr:hypothetical protein [Malaciobacter halophilus]AXH08929.1 putative membrane protein [Malaciobacter halophilus]PKI79751.1 hypothetical protein CP960_12870 [Malaciobacter halophilus]
MGLKKYIVFSILLIILIFGYVFSVEPGEYKITVLDISLTLPVAVWVILPLIVLFIGSVSHMVYYSLKSYLKYRSITKDEENVMQSIKAYLLQKGDKTTFKTKAFKDLTNILSQVNFEVKKDTTFTTSNDEINKIVSLIKDINNGVYVQDKTIKLDPTSKLAHQNLLNKINAEIDFCVEVLKKPMNYSSDVIKQAFLNVVEEKSMTTVKKLYENVTLDKEMGKKLFEKSAKNPDFAIINEEVIKITKNLEYDKNDFLDLAKLFKDSFQPDDLISLFEDLSKEIECSTEAYFYVLFEFEMIDKIRELLNTYPDEDFLAFRAMIDLKDSGKQYSLENLCYRS